MIDINRKTDAFEAWLGHPVTVKLRSAAERQSSELLELLLNEALVSTDPAVRARAAAYRAAVELEMLLKEDDDDAAET